MSDQTSTNTALKKQDRELYSKSLGIGDKVFTTFDYVEEYGKTSRWRKIVRQKILQNQEVTVTSVRKHHRAEGGMLLSFAEIKGDWDIAWFVKWAYSGAKEDATKYKT